MYKVEKSKDETEAAVVRPFKLTNTLFECLIV